MAQRGVPRRCYQRQRFLVRRPLLLQAMQETRYHPQAVHRVPSRDRRPDRKRQRVPQTVPSRILLLRSRRLGGPAALRRIRSQLHQKRFHRPDTVSSNEGLSTKVRHRTTFTLAERVDLSSQAGLQSCRQTRPATGGSAQVSHGEPDMGTGKTERVR